MTDDALWYEAALLVGITNAINVVADSPLQSLAPAETGPEAEQVFAEIRAFYDRAVPAVFRRLGGDPGYLADVWAATHRAFSDNRLTRRFKEALAFAVSVTTRSPFGTTFHLEEMKRLGVGDRGVMEVLGVTQMFSSYTKIADTLQLESDMHDIAPVDWSPAPGGGRHGPVHRQAQHLSHRRPPPRGSRPDPRGDLRQEAPGLDARRRHGARAAGLDDRGRSDRGDLAKRSGRIRDRYSPSRGHIFCRRSCSGPLPSARRSARNSGPTPCCRAGRGRAAGSVAAPCNWYTTSRERRVARSGVSPPRLRRDAGRAEAADRDHRRLPRAPLHPGGARA